MLGTYQYFRCRSIRQVSGFRFWVSDIFALVFGIFLMVFWSLVGRVSVPAENGQPELLVYAEHEEPDKMK
ncbi:MAG: hypothetical protein FJ134_16245 [Deltaproteobacteria bacterium]|nr:hypothetical protein [Deltaproteobacteria bacterium]